MRFEAATYVATGTEQPELLKFLQHYNFVTKFLTQFNQNKFRMGTDVRLESSTIGLRHNQPTTINHPLGLTGNLLIQGRVEMYVVNAVREGEIVITPKLLTTPLVNLRQGLNLDALTVMDPTLFKSGDTVAIGEYTRSITSISFNTLMLDSPVVCDNVYVVSLATETAKVFVF